jgi:hypothetical protein
MSVRKLIATEVEYVMENEVELKPDGTRDREKLQREKAKDDWVLVAWVSFDEPDEYGSTGAFHFVRNVWGELT